MSQINTRIRIEAAIGVIPRQLAPARPPPWIRASETKQSEIQHACWCKGVDWDRVVAHRIWWIAIRFQLVSFAGFSKLGTS